MQIEAECTRCKETFVPVSLDPEDLIHYGRDDGVTDCGGLGLVRGFHLYPGEMMPDFGPLRLLEAHALDMPNCSDPDCEFHHPDVIERSAP